MRCHVIDGFKRLGLSTGSCSIVSNSPSLLGSGLGDLIDRNDVVVRLNAAPTDGFEDAVGARTDIRVLNGVLQKGKSHRESDTPDNWIAKLRNETLLLKPAGEIAKTEARKRIHSSNKILTVRSQFRNYLIDIADEAGLPLLSTGLFSILVFIHVFDSVDLFGFDFYNCSDESGSIHYWETIENTSVNLLSHNFELEKRLVTCYLTKNFDIRSFKGDI